jgi:hypothetical protein
MAGMSFPASDTSKISLGHDAQAQSESAKGRVDDA